MKRMSYLIILVIIAGLSLFAKEYNHARYTTGIKWFGMILEELQVNQDYLFEVKQVEDINEDPEQTKEAILNHNAYVIGPKWIFYYMVLFIWQGIRFFTSIGIYTSLYLAALIMFTINIFLIMETFNSYNERVLEKWVYLLPWFSVPSLYYVLYTPNYVHFSVTILLSSLLLMRASSLKRHLVLAGIVASTLVGVTAAAPVYFLWLVFQFAFGVTDNIKERGRKIMAFIMGIVVGLILSELIFRLMGNSFFVWSYGHLYFILAQCCVS